MSAGVLYASPNELQRIREKEDKARRLLRLKQDTSYKVRQQEKQLAESRRSRYREKAGQEWAEVVGHLHEDWRGKQQHALSCLRQAKEQSAPAFGAAHGGAETAVKNKNERLKRLREEIRLRQKDECLRSESAAAKFQEEERLRTEPAVEKRLLLDRVAEAERERAACVAEEHRQRVANSVPDVEIPSKPVARMLANRMGRHGQFDDTYFHKDCAAIRCQPQGNRRDAREAAAAVAADADTRLQSKMIEVEQSKKRADERYQGALQEIIMEKRKDTLCKELQSLVQEDRKRRTINAVHHAQLHRLAYLEMEEEALKGRFARQFRIVHETRSGATSNETSAGRRVGQENSMGSFEFILDTRRSAQ
ncbi:hypothetical protein HK104_002439 [Borealophlyctis nickersoniae]|nr:hypothetical protein HK104_002439 [Borealophlyctis nickersoniae]